MPHASDQAIDWPSALEEHRPWLQKVLRCRVGDRHEVDDLFQEIALAVFKQHKSTVPQDPTKVAPWLYRLAVRQAVNFHRKTNRKSNAKPMAELDDFSTTPQPLDWMLAQEQQENLQWAMSQLRSQEREILTLKYSQNWSYRQIADHLGVPTRTVEYRLLNARNQLRRNLVKADSEHAEVLTKPKSRTK